MLSQLSTTEIYASPNYLFNAWTTLLDVRGHMCLNMVRIRAQWSMNNGINRRWRQPMPVGPCHVAAIACYLNSLEAEAGGLLRV